MGGGRFKAAIFESGSGVRDPLFPQLWVRSRCVPVLFLAFFFCLISLILLRRVRFVLFEILRGVKDLVLGGDRLRHRWKIRFLCLVLFYTRFSDLSGSKPCQIFPSRSQRFLPVLDPFVPVDFILAYPFFSSFYKFDSCRSRQGD